MPHFSADERPPAVPPPFISFYGFISPFYVFAMLSRFSLRQFASYRLLMRMPPLLIIYQIFSRHAISALYFIERCCADAARVCHVTREALRMPAA